MTDFEVKALDRLQRAHDDLKACDFRSTLSEDDLPMYVTQLNELSAVWSHLCYNVSRPEPEDKLFKQFCSWIHDYNSLILRIKLHRVELHGDIGLLRAKTWLPYFEAVLNMTHVYLDTGSMKYFYNAQELTDKGARYNTIGERWCLITKEDCGIDSPYLPRYFPINLPLYSDSAAVKEYFLKERYYGLKKVSQEQRLADFEDWEANVKPVILWINKNLVPKSAQEGDLKSAIWRACPKK